jgi:hypothetical protein
MLIKLHLDQSKVKKRTFEVLCFTNKHTKNYFVEKYEVDRKVFFWCCFLLVVSWPNLIAV